MAEAVPLVLYLTHAEVAVEPAIPVPEWRLSPRGRERTEAFARLAFATRVQRIVSSTERKALETAAILAEAAGVAPETRTDMHENDRSATGFLPPQAFEAAADRFFAEPEASFEGWERAIDAQTRIRRAVDAALAHGPRATITVLVGHGAVGTLLYCALSGLPIDRRHDQGPGGGNWFAFPPGGKPICGWQRMETDPSVVLE